VTECGAVEIAHLACAITRRDHALLQQLRARDLLVQFGRRDGGQVEAAVAELKATTYLSFLAVQVVQERQLVVAIAAQVDKEVTMNKMQLL
jgi:hypothetical protein